MKLLDSVLVFPIINFFSFCKTMHRYNFWRKIQKILLPLLKYPNPYFTYMCIYNIQTHTDWINMYVCKIQLWFSLNTGILFLIQNCETFSIPTNSNEVVKSYMYKDVTYPQWTDLLPSIIVYKVSTHEQIHCSLSGSHKKNIDFITRSHREVIWFFCAFDYWWKLK